MVNTEERIKLLEEQISTLQLNLHASRIAITILSTAYNKQLNKPGYLAHIFDEGVKQAKPVEFDSPVPDGYAEELHATVLSLLSKAS